jgi:hypothetical protein
MHKMWQARPLSPLWSLIWFARFNLGVNNEVKLPFVLPILALSVSIDSAHARIDCHHDPVCQAQRDGTSVGAARRTDGAMTACLHAVGYTQEDWHAYRVPAAAATKVRSCFRRHGINE